MIKSIIIFISLIGSVVFSQDNYLKDEVLVKLYADYTIKNVIQSVEEDNVNLHVIAKKLISKKLNIWRLGYNEDVMPVEQFLNIIDHNRYVEVSQFNHTNIFTRDTCPNDTDFALRQWSMNNTGQTGGTVGADIDACKAWDFHPSDSLEDTTYYGDKIVVAVIDDGFDLNHQDLNFFVNNQEIPNDSIDNDGNGFIDDVQGWNFYWDSNLIYQANHGTHVSGIIGAKGNNNEGVTGVLGGVSILPVQGSSGIESTVIESYDYVLTMRDLYDSTNGAKGAFVVATNSSFGVDNGDPASYPLWCAFYDTLGSRGILNVAATANNNVNVDVVGDIPTTCSSPYVIAVTNTTGADTKNSSGYGVTHIDMGAPGSGIYSTTSSGGYGTQTGTSQATPHVAGAVAFIYAVACSNFMQIYYNEPDSVALLVKEAIVTKGDPLGALNAITVSGRRLNLYNSAFDMITYGLCSLTDLEEDIYTDRNTFKLYPNPSNGQFTIEFLNNTVGSGSLNIFDNIGKMIYQEEISVERNGKYLFNNDLTKGCYYLDLKLDNGRRKVTKFMIN